MNRGVSKNPAKSLLALALACGLALSPVAVPAQDGAKAAAAKSDVVAYVPDLLPLIGQSTSELREVVERYSSDRAGLLRRYDVAYSPTRREKLREFFKAWQARLDTINFDALSHNARVDYILLKSRLARESELLAREEKNVAEAAPLLPFAAMIIDLQEARRRMEPLDPATAAGALAKLSEQIEKTRKAVEAGLKPEPKTEVKAEAKTDVKAKVKPAPKSEAKPAAKAEQKPAPKVETKPEAKPEAKREAKPAEKPEAKIEPIKTTKVIALRSSEILTGLKRSLEQWYNYYSGYDPLFTWWAKVPYKKADDAVTAYLKVLRENVLGIKPGEDEPIIGDPIGKQALLTDLAFEMIPYTPEDLVAVAEREFAWCEAEMLKASREMGFGDDWKKALEKVKSLHVEPGKQADLIRDQAREAIEYVEKRDLVTVPPLARDIWRIEMMTPERQKVSPFFLGGEVILVSFPTDTMAHEDKLMSMRGNNIHFARATVFHELIPGHHLQGFMTERYNSHRQAFVTPFWTEGWSLYWEMLLWDLGFPQSPENKVGMLFWRMHRCARIIFSLGFHLGTMTPQQCIDFLVDRVGHERANAAAEVRRSFGGTYPPLYQIAYMMGGLQFRALHKELVESGKMSNRDFHDAILKGGRIPVEMVRAMLTKAPLARDYSAQWKFVGDLTKH